MGVGFLDTLYPWVKAAHLIFVIFWMAALFMFPRMLIYHQEAELGSPEAEKWVEREGRMLRIIMNPSMIIVWLLGLALLINYGIKPSNAMGPVGWLHLKLLLVLGLSGYHGWMAGYSKKLAAGNPSLDGKTLRLLNEVPGVAIALIVVLAIVKPF